MKFEEFSLSDKVSRAIRDMGFSVPTPIQEKSIPYSLSGRDIIGQAQTGTGKTLAFGIPMVERIVPLERAVQAVVLTPTRELAVQVAKEIEKVGKYRQITVLPIYGGQPIEKQLGQLRKGVHVVVGTPQRANVGIAEFPRTFIAEFYHPGVALAHWGAHGVPANPGALEFFRIAASGQDAFDGRHIETRLLFAVRAPLPFSIVPFQ